MINRLKVFLICAFCIMCANSAFACSVCAVGKEEARGAYYATTAVMSLLPLCMVGGLIYYVAKKSR